MGFFRHLDSVMPETPIRDIALIDAGCGRVMLMLVVCGCNI